MSVLVTMPQRFPSLSRTGILDISFAAILIAASVRDSSSCAVIMLELIMSRTLISLGDRFSATTFFTMSSRAITATAFLSSMTIRPDMSFSLMTIAAIWIVSSMSTTNTLSDITSEIFTCSGISINSFKIY